MKFFSRRIKALFIFLVVVLAAGIYFVTQGQSFFGNSVPEDFRNARLQGALISQNIVDLSNQLDNDLQNVNDLDKQNRFNDALAATNDIIARSEDIRNKAYDLSKQMQIMAQALPNIKSDTARQAALNSITNRLTLITNLVNYSNHLNDLLVELRTRFSGQAAGDDKVAALIGQINDEVTAINSFNKQATDQMNQFDQIIKGGQ